MPLVLLLLLPAIAVLIYGHYLFCKFIEIQYESHRDAWIADGKPNGLFWSAPEDYSLSGNLSGQILQMKIVFKTPEWVSNSNAAQRNLKRQRIIAMIWYLSVLSMVGFVFFR